MFFEFNLLSLICFTSVEPWASECHRATVFSFLSEVYLFVPNGCALSFCPSVWFRDEVRVLTSAVVHFTRTQMLFLMPAFPQEWAMRTHVINHRYDPILRYHCQQWCVCLDPFVNYFGWLDSQLSHILQDQFIHSLIFFIHFLSVYLNFGRLPYVTHLLPRMQLNMLELVPLVLIWPYLSLTLYYTSPHMTHSWTWFKCYMILFIGKDVQIGNKENVVNKSKRILNMLDRSWSF